MQSEYDGIIAACRPTPDEMEASRAILAAIDEPLLYARVDLVRLPTGGPALIELELIELDLYLDHDPASGLMFATAVAELIAR